MGQKINPKGFRIGPLFTWTSRWYANKRDYQALLLYDIKLRESLFLKLKTAGLAQVEIERSINKMKVTLHVSRPGMVIGRGGSGMEDIKKYVTGFLKVRQIPKNPYDVHADEQVKTVGRTKVEVAVEPVKEPNLNAYLVAQNISDQIIKRIPHKRVCHQTIDRVISSGAVGVRIVLAGRINGAEIARREKFQAGTVPLSTIRESVDFASVPALTKSGYVGVKVWICKKTT